MKEGLPGRIEQLYSRRSRLSHIVDQRRHIYDVIGTGRVKLPNPDEVSLDNIETVRRVGKVKQRVSSSIERINSKMSQVGQEIVGVEEELIFQASDYTNRVNSVGSKTNEIRQYVEKGHLPRSLLKGLESQLKNLVSEPERNPNLQYGLALLKQRQEEQKQEEAKKEWPKIVVNFDTQEITALGKVKKIDDPILWGVLSRLAQSAGQNVSAKELKEIIDNARPSSLKKVHYVSDVIWLLRGRLETAILIPDYQPISCSGPFSKNAEYCLNARVEKIGVPQIPIATPQVSEVLSEVLKEEAKVELPEIVINVEGQEITISGRVKKITDPFEWKIFYRLASTPGQNVSSKELETLAKDSILAKEKGKKHRWMGDIIYQLRRSIKNLSFIPDYQPISRFGGKGKVEYCLNARIKGIPQPDEEKENVHKKISKETVVVFGLELQVTNLQKAIIEGLQCGSEVQPVTKEEIAEFVLGEEIKSGRITKEAAASKVNNYLGRLRKKLSRAGIEVVNTASRLDYVQDRKASYYLKKREMSTEEIETNEPLLTQQVLEIFEQATEEETTPPVQEVFGMPVPEEENIEIPSPIQPLPFEDEVVRIPYAPSREELRSPVETKVLSDILNTLHKHTRLWFNGLLESFYTVGRLQRNGGHITEDTRKLGREITNMFENAYRKMLREKSSPILRERWTDEDKRLWELLQATKGIWKIESDDSFVRKTKQLIKTATEEYYEMHKQ